MTTTTATATRCWQITYPDETAEHFTTRADAAAFLNRRASGDGTIHQVEHECHVLRCTRCGGPFTDAETVHFTSVEEGVREAVLAEWSHGPDGLACDYCTEENQ